MDAAHFKQKVAQCRRLADLLRPGDPTREALLKLAEEYDTAAAQQSGALHDHWPELVGEAIAVTAADMGNMQMLDTARGVLRLVASRGFGERFLTYFAAVPAIADSACGAALRRAGRMIVPDVRHSQIFAGKRSGEILREAGVRSVQSTPILDKAGCVIGMISTHKRAVWQPSEEQLGRLDTVVARAAELIGSLP